MGRTVDFRKAVSGKGGMGTEYVVCSEVGTLSVGGVDLRVTFARIVPGGAGECYCDPEGVCPKQCPVKGSATLQLLTDDGPRVFPVAVTTAKRYGTALCWVGLKSS